MASPRWMALVLALAAARLIDVQPASARSGPDAAERRVLPVTSGASSATEALQTGEHGVRRSDGAAHRDHADLRFLDSAWIGRISPGNGTAGAPSTGSSGGPPVSSR